MKNDAVGVRKGAWTKEEDILLTKCIQRCGEGKWHLVPMRAGLNRCRKSCRLRWLNYLRPDIKRGYFSKDEVDLVARLHKLLGNRWSLIAGRIPGRTANDVKNFWNTNISKKSRRKPINITETGSSVIIKPQPRTFFRKQSCVGELIATKDDDKIYKNQQQPSNKNQPLLDQLVPPEEEEECSGGTDECMRWWAHLLKTTENEYAPLSFPEDNTIAPIR